MSVLLADIARNGRERIRISVSEWKGVRFADIRIFATASDGATVPTKTGVTLRPDMIRPAIVALEAAERALATRGVF